MHIISYLSYQYNLFNLTMKNKNTTFFVIMILMFLSIIVALTIHEPSQRAAVQQSEQTIKQEIQYIKLHQNNDVKISYCYTDQKEMDRCKNEIAMLLFGKDYEANSLALTQSDSLQAFQIMNRYHIVWANIAFVNYNGPTRIISFK